MNPKLFNPLPHINSCAPNQSFDPNAKLRKGWKNRLACSKSLICTINKKEEGSPPYSLWLVDENIIPSPEINKLNKSDENIVPSPEINKLK